MSTTQGRDHLPEYANLLRELRHARGWSDKVAAEKLGVARSTYRNAENGRATPKVFQKIDQVYPKESAAVLAAWRKERVGGREPAVDIGVLPTLGRAITVGTGVLHDLEDRHNYVRIAEFVKTAGRAQVLLGSPYLRYWLESQGRCRLERLLEDVPDLSAEVVLFKRNNTPGARSDNDYLELAERLNDLERRYPRRLASIVSQLTLDLSYVTYEFQPTTATVLRRMLVGFQIAEYAERPFLEIISEPTAADPVTKTILDFHTNVMGEKRMGGAS